MKRSGRNPPKRTKREKPTRSLQDAMAISDRARYQALAAMANKGGQGRSSGRKGKKGLVVYVDPAVTTAMKRLAVENDTTVQELCRYALNLLFAKHALQTRA